MCGISQRQGNDSDKEWLYDIYCRTMKSCIETTWGWDEEFQYNGFSENLSPKLFTILLSMDKVIGGYVLIDKGDHFWLEMILIKPEYQRKGFGKWVIQYIQQLAKNRGIPVKLNIIKANPVKPFYERLGFTKYDEDESFHKMVWST